MYMEDEITPNEHRRMPVALPCLDDGRGALIKFLAPYIFQNEPNESL